MPDPQISPAAFDLIVDEETGGEAYYNKTEINPDWPGGESGVTIGIGYDCGYADAATIKSDWGQHLPANAVDALAAVAGIKGHDAHTHARELRWISVPWDAALAVFTQIDVPKWTAIVLHHLPNCDKLSPDSLGAIVSLAFNRGPSFDAEGDRYTEMRNIKAHMADGEFSKIASRDTEGNLHGEFMSMRRLWPQGGDLWKRREHEATLFVNGLATQKPKTDPQQVAVAPNPDGTPPPPAAPAPSPSGKILDTNRNTYGKADALKAAGYTTVIRYIAYALEHHEKVIKAGESRYLAENGLRLGLVYEIGGRPSGAMVGQRDGSYALTYAQTVGAPKGAIIWYTVDWDAGPGDMAGIRAAFRAFKQAIGSMYRTGCYGSGFVCNDLKANGLCDARWLTDSKGFLGTRDAIAKGEYEMLQSLPQTIAGLDTDPDARHRAVDGTDADIGDFIPFAESVYSPAA